MVVNTRDKLQFLSFIYGQKSLLGEKKLQLNLPIILSPIQVPVILTILLIPYILAHFIKIVYLFV